MRILQLCPKPPDPPIDGGCFAMAQLAQGLRDDGHLVHTLALATPKHPPSEHPPAPHDSPYGSECIMVDTRLRIGRALRGTMQQTPYVVSRFDHRPVHQRLGHLLKTTRFDVIHLESPYVAPYLATLRSLSPAPVVLRAHNVESKIWSDLASRRRRNLLRGYFALLSRQLQQYELEFSARVDGIAAVTADVATFFRRRSRTPVLHIPVGLSIPQAAAPSGRDPFFLGSMEWRPNRQAIAWFLRDVWPGIHARRPGLRFFLAGKGLRVNDTRWQRPGVEVAGQVRDAHRFMRSKGPLLVPMRSGSGVSIKILQAMALGKAIISTTLGARGVDCRPGKHILIADTPQAFAQQIDRCVSQPERMSDLGSAAREFLRRRFCLSASTTRLLELYRKAGAR